MNSTPPIARFSTSRVFGAVCPMYWPTRSSRVTATRWPFARYPSRCRTSAIRTATVVLPVPGLPVKHMCRVGRSESRPNPRRNRSTSSSEATSRMRVFTGASPTSSRSSCSSTSNTLEPRNSSSRSTIASAASRGGPASSSGGAGAGGPVGGPPRGIRNCVGSLIARLRPVAVARGTVGGVGVEGVAELPVVALLPLQPEARLMLGPLDDEAQRRRLPPQGAVVRVDPDVLLGVGLAAAGDLEQDRRGVAHLEHRQAPHVPQKVAGVGVVGVLDRDRPAVVDAVLHLGLDLLVGEGRQVGEGPLRDVHRRSSLTSRRRRRQDVGGVGGLVVEGDVAPDVERRPQRL